MWQPRARHDRRQRDAAKGGVRHLEFHWGRWLRDGFDVSSYDLTDLATYLDLVEQTSHAMAALTDTHVVDGMSLTLHGAETAAELGKLAFALDYKTSPAP